MHTFEAYINTPLEIEKELLNIFKRDDDLTIFDIGACEGEESIKYGKLFPNSKIFAFEPLPKNKPTLEKNFKKYSDLNITLINKALSDKEGQAKLFASYDTSEASLKGEWDYGNKSSSLLEPDKHGEIFNSIKFSDDVIVETTTIDNYCKLNNINLIDFAHLDVQGAELKVLEGGKDILRNIKVIWMEVSKISLYKNQPLYDEVNSFMADNNFTLLKDTVKDTYGDQLYINKAYCSRKKLMFLKFYQMVKSLTV